MKVASVQDFYQEISTGNRLLPLQGIDNRNGHFNVFDIATLPKDTMPYNRRAYYKISLIDGRNRAEYADKVIALNGPSLLFATPSVPYQWVPQDDNPQGLFCIFTVDFMDKRYSGRLLDQLPIFRPGGYPIFQLNDMEAAAIRAIFERMQQEVRSDYAFREDLLQNYVMELIHFGQKLQPVPATHGAPYASARVYALFLELLERQFPVLSPQQALQLRTAKDYAGRLAVHVNHLNKVLKENAGITTTAYLNNRVLQEAKILLKHTRWNVSEIACALGFEEVAHFSNFFKKRTRLTPVSYRSSIG